MFDAKFLFLCYASLLAGVSEGKKHTAPAPSLDEVSELLQDAYETYTMTAIESSTGDEVETLKSRVATLARQLVMQQLFVEEKVRSDGNSGIKQVRHHFEGTRPYHSASHTGTTVASLHDHSNNVRTIGLGEFVAVLNGVEFRTRHNDYGLRMPSRTSSKYHDVEDIPFPDVPPAVLQHHAVADQIKEMREWFKAWKKQDHSVRDYRKYFKPVLCYMEGAWTISDKLDESFHSDRHFLDASSWFDLQEKVRYTSYTGGKSNLENFSYLPTTIMNMINGTLPQIAQWNYRILCHPLKRDVPLSRFRVVDDLMARMANRKTMAEHLTTRAARFTVNPFDSNEWVDGRKNYGLLDELMAEVPGKDNYGAKLYDDAFSTVSYSYNSTNNRKKLNVGYYHRWTRVGSRDAMGRTQRHRGFADENLFTAMTTQPKVAGVELNVCTGWRRNRCTLLNKKWTYAFPLEIIYMTPLLKWNPYEIQYKGDAYSSIGRTVTAGGRVGSYRDTKKAFNGTNSKRYYHTPYEFFASGEVGSSRADTVKRHAGVLDWAGRMHTVKASGTRMMLPFIPGVGSLRTRYPIMPVHGEGSGVWKELEALKDIVLSPIKFAHMFRENWQNLTSGKGIVLLSAKARNGHVHRIVLSSDEFSMSTLGRTFLVETEESQGHNHEMWIRKKSNGHFIMVKCDGARICFDGHTRKISLATPEDVDEAMTGML